MDNANSKEYLEKIRMQVIENLRRTTFAPSVQMTDVPRGPLVEGMDDEADAILDDLDEDENKDKRFTKRRFDQYIEREGELSESEDEEEQAANGVRRQPNSMKRRNKVNYRNLDGDSGIDSGIVTPREASSVPDEEGGADEKMEGVENAEAQDKRSPSPTEPVTTRSESRLDGEDTSARNGTGAAGAEDERAPSEPPSNRESVQDNVDGDTTMEDATLEQAAQEPEEPSAALHERTPPKSPTTEAPPAPAPTAPTEHSEPSGPPTEVDQEANKAGTPTKPEEEP